MKFILFLIRFLKRVYRPWAVKYAYSLFFTAQTIPVHASNQKGYDQARRFTESIEGHEIHFYEWGEGDRTVLFHHGWSGRGSQATHFVDTLNLAGFKVLSFDGPAHGETAGSTSNMLEFSRILKVISETHGPFAGVIAHSFGGMVTSYSLSIGVLATEKIVIIGAPYSLLTVLDYYLIGVGLDPAIDREPFIERMRTAFRRDWETLSGEYTAPHQTVPALFIHDENDKEMPVSQALLNHQHWPKSEIFITKGLGHRRILRDPTVAEKAALFIKGD